MEKNHGKRHGKRSGKQGGSLAKEESKEKVWREREGTAWPYFHPHGKRKLKKERVK